MILCPACSAPNLRPDQGCTACGFAPTKVDGFLAWAPEFARNSEGFREESFEGLARVEAVNFWFRSRNSIILWALRKYFPGFQSLLEVGCGTGFVLSGITQAFPDTRISGSEIFTAGLAFAAQRLPSVELQQMDARKLPYQEEFDVIAAFDVIEHILEDELVLRNFHRAIKPGGGCLITVPQHPWLWSPVDEEACHQRRYTARELHAKVRDAGFRILRSSSFVTFLLPVMLASRLASRRSGTSGGTDTLQLNSVVDGVLAACMRVEHLVIKAGVSLPIGGSRLVVLQKVAS
jgi:SAM-dependent methyltransferase